MLVINNLAKTFNKGTEYELSIFENFSLSIEQGQCVAILGTNGCGKSTLFNLVSGALKIDKGSIGIDGQAIEQNTEEQRSALVAKVYQNPTDGTVPTLTILENMSVANKKNEKFGLRKLIKKNNSSKFKKLLEPLNLGLEEKLDVQVSKLSGGQRQALSLIMATMKKPKLLLLDEHTAALDPKTSGLIMEKTRELTQSEGITTLMISHNISDAIKYSDRVIMLREGKIVLDQLSHEVVEEEIIKMYQVL